MPVYVSTEKLQNFHTWLRFQQKPDCLFSIFMSQTSWDAMKIKISLNSKPRTFKVVGIEPDKMIGAMASTKRQPFIYNCRG
jgi:hypothetical protein